MLWKTASALPPTVLPRCAPTGIYGGKKRRYSVFPCADPGISLLFNRYLPYETRIVRIYGRSGFFQSGGAYGFRDQLQDCLCMVERDPSLLREQLLRCAAHQYLTGDVQHWWHPTLHEDKGTGALSEPGTKAAARTICSFALRPRGIRSRHRGRGDLPSEGRLSRFPAPP